MNFMRFLMPLAVLSVSYSSIAAPPDAGSLQQQFRQQIPNIPQQPIATPQEATSKHQTKGQTFTIKAFQFKGNTLVNSEALNAVVARFTSHPITFNDLLFAAAEIGDFYRKQGRVARVYVPEQEISNGIVTLQIIEGRFGEWKLDGNKPDHLDLYRVSGYIDKAHKGGEILNTKRLDRALLLMDDLPGVSVVGNLASGKENGETDLVLQMGNESLVDTQLSLDNYGSRSTGEERLNGEYYIKSPFNRGDQLHGYLSHSRGNDYIFYNYSTPMGYDGWRIGANV